MPSLRARLFEQAVRRLLRPLLSVAVRDVDLLNAQQRLERWVAFLPRPRHVDIRTWQVGDLHGEWLQPHRQRADAVILYLHGGAFIIGSPATHRDLTASLAHKTGLSVLALDYRLAPQACFPAWRDDAVGAYEALLAQGYDAARIILAGDSAGGNLVLSCALQLHALGRPMPAALVLLSPWTDLHCTSASMRLLAPFDAMLDPASLAQLGRYHARAHALDDPGLSPLYGDMRGLPATLLQVSDSEILLDDGLQWADRAEAAGVVVERQIWPGMMHVFQLFCRWLPEADRAVDAIATFITAHLPAR